MREPRKFDAEPADLANMLDAFFCPDYDAPGWILMEANDQGRAYIGRLFPSAHIEWVEPKCLKSPGWKAQWINLPEAISRTEHKLPAELIRLRPVEDLNPGQLAFLLTWGINRLGGRACFVNAEGKCEIYIRDEH